jgi:hypothetical protein
MKRTAALITLALGASLALSACGTPAPVPTPTHSDTHTGHSPSDMTRENKGTTRKGG